MLNSNVCYYYYHIFCFYTPPAHYEFNNILLQKSALHKETFNEDKIIEKAINKFTALLVQQRTFSLVTKYHAGKPQSTGL